VQGMASLFYFILGLKNDYFFAFFNSLRPRLAIRETINIERLQSVVRAILNTSTKWWLRDANQSPKGAFL